MKSRLQEKYRGETVAALMKRFGWKNRMAVPKLQKITSEGWLQFDVGEALVSWMYSFLQGVQRACDTMFWWLAAVWPVVQGRLPAPLKAPVRGPAPAAG